MRTLRWLIVVVCLAVPTVIVVNPFIANHPFDEAFALPLSFAQQLDTSGSHAPSRSPRFVSVQMKKKAEDIDCR